jgi:hypothetical protein
VRGKKQKQGNGVQEEEIKGEARGKMERIKESKRYSKGRVLNLKGI